MEKKYIDAGLLSQAKFPLPASGQHSPYEIGWNDAIKAIIENTPAADVQEVRHGKWEETKIGLEKCSICGKHGFGDWVYCPRCGAIMDGGEG